jgi:pyruvate dehydrogenase E2 component (dihydrolipoamide acetyltransferase)
MAEVIEMPRLSDTMTEGVIAKWHKAIGDAVKPGDLLAEIETDKATMEFEAPIGGVLLHIGAEAGRPIPIGAPIAIIGKTGEDITGLLGQADGSKAAPQAMPQSALVIESVPVSPVPIRSSESHLSERSTDSADRIKASPLARAMARQSGIDLRQLQGTGEKGRIIRRDVEAHLAQVVATSPSSALPAASPVSTYKEVPLSQMRKTIARRLTASMQQAPHFYLTRSIRMEAAAAWREKLNTLSPIKISFNDLIIKAVATALRKHPYLNAAWMEDHIRLYEEVHIGFAVAVEEGLLVPVIRQADRKGLSEIAAETVALAQKARERKLTPEEYTSGTFSISNLGMYGIEEFTAVINPPEVAILAVGAITPTPVVKGETLNVERRMRVTLSCDHRVVDGATGAQFLQTLALLLEEPERLLL